MTERIGSTPSQTVGPYLSIVLPWEVPDGLVEVWQADPEGRFDHPDDPRGALTMAGFRGFGRCPTDADGHYTFRTVRPGPLPAGNDATEAPHLDISVFARGLLHRLVTRMYFPDEPQNADDPVLCQLGEEDRALLVGVPEGRGVLRFDIRLQGERETPFFEI
jgi:protocatechuate 3,4-dioxygenase alpha subunit